MAMLPPWCTCGSSKPVVGAPCFNPARRSLPGSHPRHQLVQQPGRRPRLAARTCPDTRQCTLAVPSSISLLQRGSPNVVRHLFDDMHSSCMSQFIAAASSFTGACPRQQSRRDAVALSEAPCCPSRWIELCPNPQLAIVEHWACHRCRACRAQQKPHRHDLFQLDESSHVVDPCSPDVSASRFAVNLRSACASSSKPVVRPRCPVFFVSN
ncbi:hypothetical protein Zm00014a_011028 [Zea mays]|uniref:Uncharacterized protein n=1 Tax=Zea mays TaxID=4577 RepID=A0A3L6EY41_MAIZE|nr:hypothetical protein Zm00014a_011028 [Zea mays]